MKPVEAAAPRARKRRSADAPNDRQSEETGSISPPLAAMDAPDPAPFGARGHRSRSRQEAPPAGGGGARRRRQGKGVDYISALPDDVLGDIISLLPTKDAGRVQTLATRWKHLWRSAPLNLDCQELPGFAADDDDALAADVSRILSRHPGPGRCLCISTRLLLHYCPDTVDAWLQSPALDNLDELCISAYLMDGPWFLPLPLTLPAPIFRFAPSLIVANLSDCSLPDRTVQTLHFPELKKLALEHVSISEGSLHSVLPSCPILECLLLVHSFGFGRVRIDSSSLRSMGVCNHDACEIIIEDAPCLEMFLCLDLDMVLRVSVIAAPKLETLGCLNFNASTSFVLGSTVIQGLRVIDETSAVCSVKMLAINMDRLSLDIVIKLMRCFPCLETLYIQPCQSVDNNLWLRKHHNFIRSHDICLKTIVFLNYQGINSQVNFATSY